MNRPLQCLIVDDEKLARTLLEGYISKLPNLQLVAQCKDPFEALTVLQSKQIDIIFLDIQMPELTGIEFLSTLQQNPAVIFTTAYPDYALESFQLDIVDYLLKPFRFDRFAQAVNKAIRRIQVNQSLTAKMAPANNSSSPNKDYLLVRADHKVHKIRFQDILFIQGMKEYVAFQMSSDRILSLQSLKQLEKELPKSQFIRIHKSYIISVDKVTTMEGNMVYVGDKKLPIGGHYKESVMKTIF